MKFSQKSEYGVRLLLALGRHYGQGPYPLAEIARTEGLSQTFLEQVIMPLRKADFVRSTHGVRGGYELTRSPESIGMGEVLRVLEGSLAPMFCVTDDAGREICVFEDSCGTRVLWARVRDGINAALDATTLNDLMRDRGDGHDTIPVMMAAPSSECGDYKPALR